MIYEIYHILWTGDVKSNEFFRLPSATGKILITKISPNFAYWREQRTIETHPLTQKKNKTKQNKNEAKKEKEKWQVCASWEQIKDERITNKLRAKSSFFFHELPGQGFWLHNRLSLFGKVHWAPPWASGGLVQVRDRPCIPPPHVLLHLFHNPHTVQLPFTVIRTEKKVILNCAQSN